METKTNNNSVMVLRGIGDHWSVGPDLRLGSGSNVLGGVTTVRRQMWSAGIYDDRGSELPLIEHR